MITDDPDEYQIKLKMHITTDLVKEILSYGEMVEVIAPKSLRKELKKRYRQALSYYS
jgi:predicted DNA-binding transcriptional regulator YafY